MRIVFILTFLALSSSVLAEVDLGNLVIEGEVRRPMLRKIESKNAMKKLLEKKAKNRLEEIEKQILTREYTEPEEKKK